MKNLRRVWIALSLGAIAITIWLVVAVKNTSSETAPSSHPFSNSPTAPTRSSAPVHAAALGLSDESDTSMSDLLTGPVSRIGASDSPDAAPLGYPATERVYLRANDQVRVPLNRSSLRTDRPVVLRADNGGVIDGRSLSPQVELSGDAAAFSFHVGPHRGLYTVTVSQGPRTETLEFWVGEPSPVGRAGPPRTITSPASLSTES